MKDTYYIKEGKPKDRGKILLLWQSRLDSLCSSCVNPSSFTKYDIYGNMCVISNSS